MLLLTLLLPGSTGVIFLLDHTSGTSPDVILNYSTILWRKVPVFTGFLSLIFPPAIYLFSLYRITIPINLEMMLSHSVSKII